MGNVEALEEGRQAFGRSEWRACFRALAQADERTPLGPEDLWRLGDAAYLSGDDDAAIAAWTRAHHALVELGEPVRAARFVRSASSRRLAAAA
jgi:hypothetical protein